MTTARLQVLFVHGVGNQDANTAWQDAWRRAAENAVAQWNPSARLHAEFVKYDDLFEAARLNAADVAAATASLLAGTVVHSIGDFFSGRRSRGEIVGGLRWTAGMVAQWSVDQKLRDRLIERLIEHAERFFEQGPEVQRVIAAHSLGSLISYDALRRRAADLPATRLVTFGSQIGHPGVRSVFGGRIEPLPTVQRWYHLFNRHDRVLTKPLRVDHANYVQVDTDFDLPGPLDHDAVAYLSHNGAAVTLWRETALADVSTRASAPLMPRSIATAKARPKPAAPRALLVGINDYPDPANRLEGCVNDVFRWSEILQEMGFSPEHIRVVLNERATASNILDRLDWLLQDAADGMPRIFLYSGHGAQVPAYGSDETVDAMDECLVTYDFDWSNPDARGITDDQFHQLYTQLHYDANFITIFDCCHSGGMTRDGGARIRGLTPPDDVRHRALKWVPELGMWAPRELQLSKQKLMDRDDKRAALFMGDSGAVKRLGRGVPVWSPALQYRAAKAEYRHHGPFMPVLIQACGEQQYAYEYRHGVTSYGAFTYCATEILRHERAAGRRVSIRSLVSAVASRLAVMKYDQAPELVGPTMKIDADVPMMFEHKPRPAGRGAKRRRR